MTDLLPRYYELLEEAQAAAEAADEYDVDSARPDSLRYFNELRADQDKAQAALLLFISSHLTELWTTFKHVGVGK